MPGWFGPKDQQNKTDKLLSVFGAMYVIVNSRKSKGKVLKEDILKDIVPRGFDVRIEEIQEKHQQAIEEKDAAFAHCDNQVRAIQHENVALQAQKEVYQAQLQRYQDQTCDLIINRHVPRANDPGKDNTVMIIEKNTTPEEDEFYEYPYYIARIQRRFISPKRRWFRTQYPHHRFITEELDNANSIHAFNWFEEEDHVERYQCHFRLADLAHDALYALAMPTIHE